MKTCNKCGGVSFYKGGQCVACTAEAGKAWRAANKDKKKAGDAAYQQKNKKRISAYQKQWREENKEMLSNYAAEYYKQNAAEMKKTSDAWRKNNQEKLRKQMAEYAKANPEKVAKIKSDWKENNVEHVRDLNIAWRAANTDKVALNHRNRRARKQGAGGVLSVGIVARLLTLQKGKCPCCGKRLGDDYHLDHKMPLVLGGTHTDDNMQLLRSKCNLQKNKKHPIDFMQSRGFLL